MSNACQDDENKLISTTADEDLNKTKTFTSKFLASGDPAPAARQPQPPRMAAIAPTRSKNAARAGAGKVVPLPAEAGAPAIIIGPTASAACWPALTPSAGARAPPTVEPCPPLPQGDPPLAPPPTNMARRFWRPLRVTARVTPSM